MADLITRDAARARLSLTDMSLLRLLLWTGAACAGLWGLIALVL